MNISDMFVLKRLENQHCDFNKLLN